MIGASVERRRGRPVTLRAWLRPGFASALVAILLLLAGNALAGRIDDLRSAAERGETRAQVLLGKAYVAGNGVEQSDAKGVHWLRLAARGGDKVGQAWLGWAYQEGRGVRKDSQRALSWYQRSARAGYTWADEQIARMQTPPGKADKAGAEGAEKVAAAEVVTKQAIDHDNNAAAAVTGPALPVEDRGQLLEAREFDPDELQTVPDLSTIEQALRKWVVSARVLTLPSSLPLDRVAEVRLEVPPPPQLEAWAAGGIGLRIIADLAVPAGRVEPLSLETQALRPHYAAVWRWTVRVPEGNVATVDVQLRARLTSSGGEPSMIDIGRIRRQLTIEGSFIDRVRPFIEENWLAISLTLVVPMFLWLGMVVAGRSRSDRRQSPGP